MLPSGQIVRLKHLAKSILGQLRFSESDIVQDTLGGHFVDFHLFRIYIDGAKQGRLRTRLDPPL